ncbi:MULTISPECIES: vanadium-dependent haloperoxidase [unclassified Bradyrhizobium]|uniref:vanadium-dependent haloperoxidase n=1 Tax=unclassified Bradyrhizobium TaxID=2631580 RepID=UPI0033999B05
MRVIQLAVAALLPWFILSVAHAQGLQPESKQEFQRVYGLTARPLTSPSLTGPAAAATRNSLQQQSANEFRRVFGQNALSGSVTLQTLSTPQTIDSISLCGVTDSTDSRKYFILWHLISLDLSALDHRAVIGNSPNTYHLQFGPARTARALALIHQAMFEASNAFERKYQSTLTGWETGPTASASQDAAIIEAAYQVSAWLYPGLNDQPADANDPANVKSLFSLSQYYICSMASLPDDAKRKAGIDIGRSVAGKIMAERSHDGGERPEPLWNKDFVPRRPPGGADYAFLQWQVDPVSSLMTALGTYWGEVKPFALTSGFQFRIAEKDSPAETVRKLVPPNAYDKLPSYTAIKRDARESRLDPSGKITQPPPGRDGLLIAQFWAYDGTANLCAPARLYNQIASAALNQIEMHPDDGYRLIEPTSTTDIARFYALINLAMADAAIAAWDSKFHFQFPRPVTYIRAFDEMTAMAANQPVTTKWFPIGAQVTNSDQTNNITPPFPSYPSGHAVFGGALFGELRQFVKPTTTFKFMSDEFNGKNKDVFNYVRCAPEDAQKDPRFCNSRDFVLDCAERENADSRLFMGVHWVFDADDGIAMGNKVASHVYRHIMRPLDAQGQAFDPPLRIFSVTPDTKLRTDLVCPGINNLPAGWDDTDATNGFGPLKIETVQ